MNITINDNRPSRISIDGKGDIDIFFVDVEKPEEITISLTPKEGAVLQDILESVGGEPECSSRKFADSIRKKLLEFSHITIGAVKSSQLEKEDSGKYIFYRKNPEV